MAPRLLIATLLAAVAAATAAPAHAEVVWAVGDGADSGSNDDAVAARIAREGLDRLLYLGDVYDRGTADEFRNYYGPSFGRFYNATSPTPGNHEWDNRASGYDPYWGQRAPRTNGGHYYAFDVGGWHFVSLNTQENVSAGSPQVQWLRQHLASRQGTCTIAFWHRPRYSGGSHGDQADVQPLLDALAGHAVAVLAGHDHNYQRMRPDRGITQWVVGSGGHGLYTVDRSHPRLAVANDTAYGALRLVLSRGPATYEFVGTNGARLDSGSLTCTPPDAAPPPPPQPAPTPAPAPAPPAADEQGTLPSADPAPRVRIRSPRAGARRTRVRTLTGTATVPAGSHLLLTLTRRVTAKRCRGYDGRRFRRVRCSRPATFAVRPKRTGRWKVRLKGRVAPGRYRLTARIKDGSRRITARASSVSFRIRARR
ncbi:MAG TPA: metallophosphoesterase [Solirubrobacteraceae bacterium]|jgi:hypothetical protein